MTDIAYYQNVFNKIINHPRYLKNIEYGEPRPSHPEGTIKAHIEELERNLAHMHDPAEITDLDYWKLRIMIHVHDSFKAESRKDVPVIHPNSHASIAARFLAEICADDDMLEMVQYHDEPYAIWRQFNRKGTYDENRLTRLTLRINDWNLFLRFQIIDGCTVGKIRDPLTWFLAEVQGKVDTNATCLNIPS